MQTISFRDGQTMTWPTYRAMMNGRISPQAAVAVERHNPAGAYDQAMPSAPSRSARPIAGGPATRTAA